MSKEQSPQTIEYGRPIFFYSTFNLDEFSVDQFDIETAYIDAEARLRHGWEGAKTVRELKYIVRGNNMYVVSRQDNFGALNEHLLVSGVRDLLNDAGFIEVEQLADGQVRREVYGHSERFYVPLNRWTSFRKGTLNEKLGENFDILDDWGIHINRGKAA